MNEAAPFTWLANGREAFAAKLAAIAAARRTIRLETYIYTASPVGEAVREALAAACARGVRVRVLADAWGSVELPDSFWQPLRAAGAEVRWFNPVSLPRLGFRDHRKLLVGDEETAIVGGFNIAPEYAGDGVTEGWCDHGLRLRGGAAADLAAAFDQMFERADFRHQPFTRLRKSRARLQFGHPDGELLLCGPGRGRNHFKRRLNADLKAAREVAIISAYFLPTWRIRRDLARVVRRGGRVRILLGAKSDVAIAQDAARSLYRRLLRAGVEIHEYQPQVLHAKLVIVDGAAYVGSANLDTRSLHINYELMLRVTQPEAVAGARALFAADLRHAVPITRESWRGARSLWDRLKQRWAYFVLARLDPLLARRQYRRLNT